MAPCGYCMYEQPANFNPPKKDKHQPLKSGEDEKFYRAAMSMSNTTTEICGRVLIDFGLRCGELAHTLPDWVGTAHDTETGETKWYIRIPRKAYCTGGVGAVGRSNPDGADLYETGDSCSVCRHRTHESKVGDGGWLDKADAVEYDFHPKTLNSIGRTWALPNQNCKRTAQKLSNLLDAHGKFPLSNGSVNRHVAKIAEESDLERHVTPHALRHTYGCRLAGQGVSLNVIMSQMRHGDLSMAQWYTELRGERQREALERDWDEGIVF